MTLKHQRLAISESKRCNYVKAFLWSLIVYVLCLWTQSSHACLVTFSIYLLIHDRVKYFIFWLCIKTLSE